MNTKTITGQSVVSNRGTRYPSKRDYRGYNVKRRKLNTNGIILVSTMAVAIVVLFALSISKLFSPITSPASYSVTNTQYLNTYSVSSELLHHLEQYALEMDVDVDLVIAIADEKSGMNINWSSNYGRGLMAMRPSTIEWISDNTETFPGEISKPETAAKTSVYLVKRHLDNTGSIERTIENICGNEYDTVAKVKEIYLENTGKELK